MKQHNLTPLQPGEPAPLGRRVGSYGIIEPSGLVIVQPTLFDIETDVRPGSCAGLDVRSNTRTASARG